MNDEPAVFDATFSDWRLVKGRKVVQIVLEVPLETAGLAYQVLGGMPDPGKSVWCAVARLKGGEQTDAATLPRSHSETVNKPGSADGAKRRWDEMSLAQQAGMLCTNPAFRRFLAETGDGLAAGIAVYDLDMAADEVRDRLGIKSRREIADSREAADKWRAIVADFRVWERALV